MRVPIIVVFLLSPERSSSSSQNTRADLAPRALRNSAKSERRTKRLRWTSRKLRRREARRLQYVFSLFFPAISHSPPPRFGPVVGLEGYLANLCFAPPPAGGNAARVAKSTPREQAHHQRLVRPDLPAAEQYRGAAATQRGAEELARAPESYRWGCGQFGGFLAPFPST